MTAPFEDRRKPAGFKRIRLWLDEQIDDRPFVTALIVLILVVTPGFIRVEQNANTANEAADVAQATAESFAAAAAKEDLKQQDEIIQSCQTRNTFQRNTRDKFDRFLNTLELLLSTSASDPERAKRVGDFIQQLRESVETTPEDEDRDCNNNGEVGPSDYLP